MMRITILLIILFLAFPAAAQDFGIVAVVNDESISNVTLQQRLRLMAGNKAPSAVLRQQALNMLIEESLQRQHAKALGVDINEREMQLAIADIEARNSIKPGKLLAFFESQGLSSRLMLDQIKTQLLWKKLLARKVTPRFDINVTEVELQDLGVQVVTQNTTDEVEVSEIVLAIENNNEKAALEKAQTMRQSIADGGSFASLARQYSIGPTALNGGQIGWIAVDKLQPVIRDMVMSSPPNTLLQPVKTGNNVRIIKVGEKRARTKEMNDERLRQTVTGQKLDLEVKRYMKKLRDDAYIEIRNQS